MNLLIIKWTRWMKHWVKKRTETSNWINKVVDDLIDYELNTNRKKLIEKIRNTINFKYN